MVLKAPKGYKTYGDVAEEYINYFNKNINIFEVLDSEWKQVSETKKEDTTILIYSVKKMDSTIANKSSIYKTILKEYLLNNELKTIKYVTKFDNYYYLFELKKTS